LKLHSADDDSRRASSFLSPPGSREDWPFVWASLAGAVALYAVVCRYLANVVGPPTVDAARFLPELVQFLQPEPLEKARYIAGLVCIPTVPTALYLGLRQAFSAAGPAARMIRCATDPVMLACRDTMLVAAVVIWLAWLAMHSEIPNSGILLIVAAAVGGACYACRQWSGRFLDAACWYVVPGLLLLAWWDQTLSEGWFILDLNIWHHVDILLGAVNQVAHGKTILVDTTSQYGIAYPYVAAAATAPFGVGVRSLSVFFATLGLVQIVLVYLAIAQVPSMTRAWRAFFLATYCGLAVPMLAGALFNLPDSICLPHDSHAFASVPVYYQYFPLRTFWPTAFVWFVPRSFRSRQPWMVPLGYALAGAAFLWNADTGLLCLAAYAVTCGYRAVSAAGRQPQAVLGAVAVHVGAAVTTGVATLAAYAALCWLRSGGLPDYGELFRFQEIFYAAGFFMLPLPAWELWQPIIVLYALTVAWAMRRLVTGRATQRSAWMLFIAVYGLGAFSYYQGRSMAAFLPSSFPPAAILAFLWLHDSVRRFTAPGRSLFADHRMRSQAFVAATAGLFCMFGIVNLLRSLPMCLIYALDFTGSGQAAEMSGLAAGFAPALTGREVVILAEPSSYFHARTASWSALPVASSTEVFLKSQVAEIQGLLDRGDVPVLLHLRMCPSWANHLDLTSFRPVREYPGGFVLLRHKSATD